MSQNSPTLLPSRETGASPSCLTDHRHPLYAVQAVHHGGCLGDRSRQLWRPDRPLYAMSQNSPTLLPSGETVPVPHVSVCGDRFICTFLLRVQEVSWR